MNRRHRLRALAAELAKLRTLPAVVATLLGTVAAAAVLAGSLAAANDGRGDGIAITLETIPILQVGTIHVGVLAAPSECAGSQIRTTLIAVPKRVRAFAAKALAYRVVATVTSAVAVVVAFVTSRAVLGSDPGRTAGPGGRQRDRLSGGDRATRQHPHRSVAISHCAAGGDALTAFTMRDA